MSSTERKSFIKGALWLSLAGLIVRLVGVGYRIPLAAIIGEGGLGLYQKVYPIYAWLLVFSTAGLPTGIAKMVSERLERGDEAGARQVFVLARRLLTAVGLASTVLLVAVNRPLADFLGDPLSAPGFVAIAPALTFVAVLSAYRGYFQGMNRMEPTALSQLIEQVGKLALGLVLSSRLLRYGLEISVAGALMGVSLSELLAMLWLAVLQRRRGAGARALHRQAAEPARAVLYRLLALSLPIMLGASMSPIMQAADSAIVQNRLMDIGYTRELSRELFGLLSGMVYNVVNMPTVFSMALSMSLVPVVAASWSRQYVKDVRRKVHMGMKLSMLIALPSAVGLMVLARPVLDLLYGYSLSSQRLDVAGRLLQMSSVGIVFLAVIQTLSGVLNGMGKVFVPVIGLGLGAVVKIVLSLVLIGNPAVNIYGAPVGTVLCYVLAAAVDYAVVARLTGLGFPLHEFFLRPALATALMAAGAWFTYRGLEAYLLKWAVLPAVLAGVVIYVPAALLLRAVTAEEIRALPGGGRLLPVLRRLRLIP